MAQFDIYRNPGRRTAEIPFLLNVQNDHVSTRTGATVVIPLRSSVSTVEVLAPAVTVGGHGEFVMCTDELFAIDVTALKGVVAKLSAGDRLKVRPALDKLFGDY